MWLVLLRSPVPDAAYWPGRRLAAAIDAVAWPVAWIVALSQALARGGVVVPAAMALAVLCLVSRLMHALWRNPRYRFTTWRWGKVVGTLWLAGLVLKLALGAW